MRICRVPALPIPPPAKLYKLVTTRVRIPELKLMEPLAKVLLSVQRPTEEQREQQRRQLIALRGNEQTGHFPKQKKKTP